MHVSEAATAMATAHRSPENMSVGKRTRGVSTLGLRVGCVVRAQRAVVAVLASVLQAAS